ncbi:sulfurtransferase [Paenibacillus aurantius]|uniref:Sulfurtransferase n=1 Tax=Paenibacillus aurantius TaxID=2918900 RepID=A0AA96LDE4_9BACL|nr:sulfurtransferase [Paenibacillus aurantius]WNQ11119.1 sulfurtransferase [Paenibacillus aurantius]
MSSVVSMEWVKENLGKADVAVADCRFALGHGESGRQAYREGHLPGAVYFHLEEDLSAPIGEHGGRHPLPDTGELSRKLGEAGIGPGTTVIAYDDQGGAMASRFWWLLRYLGHEQVYLMDGGYSAWKAEGYPVTQEVPQPEGRAFIPHVHNEMVVGVEEVKAGLGRPDRVLIDSREARRYQGLEEAIDPVAGHIPGAVNRFWKDALDENGRWKDAEAMKERFRDLPSDKEIVVYCGSGVTACPNILALQQAGFPKVKLYAGSWSDWVSYPDNPVATGEE